MTILGSVLGIVLGARGNEGLTEVEQRQGIDGVEGDPVDGLQEADEVQGGLFQNKGHPGVGILLA